MKLLISQLKPGENDFSFESTQDSWLQEVMKRIEAEGYRLQTPLEVDIHLTNIEPDFYLRGKLTIGVEQTCARCAELFTLPVVHPFDIALALVSPAGRVRKAVVSQEEVDALDVNFFEGKEIDLNPILEEQFFLSIPYQSLCREECKGVCGNCGINLNLGSCDCHLSQSTSPFSVLENFNFKS